MEEEELMCSDESLAPTSAAHADAHPTRPHGSGHGSGHGDHDEHSMGERFSHGMHGAHVIHGAHHALGHGHGHAAPTSPTAPAAPAAPEIPPVFHGSGGPTDPAYWSELQSLPDGPIRRAALARAGATAVAEESRMLTPSRLPPTSESSSVLDDMRMSGGVEILEPGAIPTSPIRAPLEAHMTGVLDARLADRTGLHGPWGNPAHRPGLTGNIIYPPHEGARDGVITRTAAEVGDVRTRIGSPGGDYFAVGDPSFTERALPPPRPRVAAAEGRRPERTVVYEEHDYRVTRPFPEDRSVAAEWFGERGGAEQTHAPMSAADLEVGGYLETERAMEVTAATPAEEAEILAAAAEEEAALAASTRASLREPISPDMATMCDDIEAVRVRDAEALAAASHADDATEVASVADALESLDDADALDDLDVASHTPLTPAGRLFGVAGAVGGAYQMGTGIAELRDGDIDMGLTDLAAGGVGAGTGLAATGLFGEAAAVACAAPPVALGAALVGAVATGHHYNVEHETFGEDSEGEAMSSVDFALQSGVDSYDYVNDAIGGEEGSVQDVVGTGLGGVAGLLGGVAGGVVGLGGDLRYGVPEAIGGLYDLVTGYGDARWQEDEMWGTPTVDPETHEVDHVTSREWVEGNAHGTYDYLHDGITSVTGGAEDGTVMGTVGELAGMGVGALGGAVVGAGSGVLGLGAALGGTFNRGASDLASAAHSAWSWITD